MRSQILLSLRDAQPGRSYISTNSYRFGFNGKENDNDVKGKGNQQYYGMRIYDPRLGKFLSVDPITKKYPELTPYQFASNRPIDGIDQDGLEYLTYQSSIYKMGFMNNIRMLNTDLSKNDIAFSKSDFLGGDTPKLYRIASYRIRLRLKKSYFDYVDLQFRFNYGVYNFVYYMNAYFRKNEAQPFDAPSN